MVIATLAFYLFSPVAVVSGLMVVLSRNPVHSVLWLILPFFSAAGLFVILGAEFVAMLLVIVYVGAVMVLTMRHRKDVKRQNIVEQIYRDADKAVEMIDVKPGQGL